MFLAAYIAMVAIVTGLPLGLFAHPIRLRRKPR